MTRSELEAYIMENYSVERDYPWAQYPEYEVFRHGDNRKWFAIIMNVSGDKLGLKSNAPIDIVNLKVDSLLIYSLRETPGFMPAYHMNKHNWISAALDGTAPGETIKNLLDMSYESTAKKRSKRKADN